jgi:hypothetical protein
MTTEVRTQPWTKERMHALLDRSDAAVVRAALAIYARQTAAEQAGGYTDRQNGVGFSKFDAEPMTRFVQFVNNGWRISPKFLNFARKRIKHYWRQLIEIAEAQPSTPAIAPEVNIAPALASEAPTEVKGVRLCTCEWGDGEPGVTCPSKKLHCCTGGKVSVEHVNRDPDLYPEARSW